MDYIEFLMLISYSVLAGKLIYWDMKLGTYLLNRIRRLAEYKNEED